MSTDKGPPKREAPTGSTNTDHEATLLDKLWNEVPHNDPQAIKDGVLAIIQQLKAEHEAEVNKIRVEHDHQTTLARIDHLQLVISLKEDISKKEVAISEVQLEKESLVTLRDFEIKNLKKDYQEAIQGYIRRERDLEADKAAALQDKKMASNLQHNSLEESNTLRKEAEKSRSKCNDLQQALRDTNQEIERQSSQLLDIGEKRNEEKEQLQRAESCLESMEPMEVFLEQRDFLSESDTHRPLSWPEMERAIRAAAYGALNISESSPTTSGSLINSSRQLVKLAKQDGEDYEHWRSSSFYECAHDLVSEIMETAQNSNRLRKVMEKDERYIDRILNRN
ncbi:hypothetical protein BFW01_g3192 [Lasiodiplodia theobromae]|nr:hypothetical protein BFW01_g3192 [Lasiodiplodia theobromae]